MTYKHAILGGTGHIGSALSEVLLRHQQSVLVIGRDADKAGDWIKKGAAYEVADVNNTAALSALFRQAERLFILNPPAAPDADTDALERQQIKSILEALEDCAPQKIVAISAYGAQEGDDIFDLGSLYELEKGLAKVNAPVAIIRNAYYMSNLDQAIDIVKDKGELATLFPEDFKVAMVAHEDVGNFAAELMMDEREGLFCCEGPEHYSYRDVANVLSDLLHKDVRLISIPETGWHDFLVKAGFSEKAAASFVNMNKLTITDKFETPNAHIGKTSLKDYLKKVLLQQ
ncbi:MAG: NAD(P)H-binding protein [Bacteroidota bacterium]